MKRKFPNLLGAIVRDYFGDHLPRVRGTSPHSIHSYRDSVMVLLRFLSACNKRNVAELHPASWRFSPTSRENGRMEWLHETSGSLPFMPCFVSWLRGIQNIWIWRRGFWLSPSNGRRNAPSTIWSGKRSNRF
jgi:hypothetical protein